MTATLLVLAKKPVPGKVKTRLCPPFTPHQAARIAAAALEDTLDTLRETPAARRILAAEGELTAAGFEILRQRGDGLGDRIANAFADAGGPGPIFQIGMDTPQLRPQVISDALEQLRNADAVLGPAFDGGWWALGLHEPQHAGLLRSVPMSTPDTGELTIRALRGAGLRVGLLPQLRDVDTAADAALVAAERATGRFAREVAVML